MLTPVDIQQKKFHVGLGYDKKDVNAFFEMVSESYEQLYRSNAELKEKVATLTDGLQNYKSKEQELEKSIMIAAKDSEESKSKAVKEAKTIELDAKNKAKVIVEDAEKRLKKLEKQIKKLETQYAAYKSNFVYFMQKQFELLGETDFDPKSYIDPQSLQLLGGQGAPAGAASQSSFGSFDGDPQMRDESTLGGFAGNSGMSREDMTSTSAVYTSSLRDNENFVDPFNPDKEQVGRYNPYDGRTVKKKPGSTNFTVTASGSSAKYKKTATTNQAAKSKTTSQHSSTSSTSKASTTGTSTSRTSTSGTSATGTSSTGTHSSTRTTTSHSTTSSTAKADTEKPKQEKTDYSQIKASVASNLNDKSTKEKAEEKIKAEEEIPTVDLDVTSAEVEYDVKDSNLLGDGDSEDDDFTFV